jgi:hypothetical protein
VRQGDLGHVMGRLRGRWVWCWAREASAPGGLGGARTRTGPHRAGPWTREGRSGPMCAGGESVRLGGGGVGQTAMGRGDEGLDQLEKLGVALFLFFFFLFFPFISIQIYTQERATN